jgi:hypothetical protein
MSSLGMSAEADRGGIAAGRDVNIGATPEEVQTMIAAALAQQQNDRVEALAKELGATEGIITAVLLVLAPHVERRELQPQAPPELVRRLTEERVTALREQRLLAEAETDPTLRRLRQRAVAAQTDGDDAEATSALEAITTFHRDRRLARQAMQSRLAAAIDNDARSEAQALAEHARIA